ncbi:VENN motif pre-toxin domain-containing protein, partial [Rosenbergiella sp. S61]
GGDTASAVSGMQTGKVTVENNSLGDIAQAQSEGKTVEQKAGEYVEAENERYKKANCGGMSAEACSVKMYTERREALKNTLSTGADFLPIIGTIKSAAEAQSALDYLNVAASLIPGERVASGVLKAAEKALVKGDVTEASKLINKASDEIKVKWVDENASMSQRARDYNDSASGARSNIETQKGQAPSIDRVDANGLNKPVRFDGVDGNVMIDRKISVVTTQKAKDQAIRQSEALKNNGMTGRWEVPTQAQANRAQKMFDELGIKNIEVKVVNE